MKNIGYYPIAHEAGPNMNRKPGEKLNNIIFQNDKVKKYFTMPFMICWIHRLGLKVHGTVIDTMVIAASVIDENRFRYDLNSVAKDYVDEVKMKLH